MPIKIKEGAAMKNQNKNEGKERKNKKGPSAGAEAHKEGQMNNTETREQTVNKIEFYLPTLTDEQLRMVAGFIRGIKKG